MIQWVKNNYLLIESSSELITETLKKTPLDCEEYEILLKELYPYRNGSNVIFHIVYLEEQYTFTIPQGFRWNGTNCLFLQYYPKLLDASMVHDYLCNHHNVIGYDRQLSSIIFREIGIASGMNKTFMKIAYWCVDIFQKYFGKDINNNKWNEHS